MAWLASMTVRIWLPSQLPSHLEVAVVSVAPPSGAQALTLSAPRLETQAVQPAPLHFDPSDLKIPHIPSRTPHQKPKPKPKTPSVAPQKPSTAPEPHTDAEDHIAADRSMANVSTSAAGNVVRSGADAVTPAEYRSPSLNNPPTEYPRAALENEVEGSVKLRVLVLASGLPGEIRIESGSGHPLLDESAAKQLKKWRFIPARRGNIAIDSWIVVPIVFKLNR